MLQATNQGGRTPPWKQQIATVDAAYNRYEYINTNSDDAFMDSIDPSLVRLGDLLCNKLHQRHTISQVDTVYDHTDAPARRTFVSDERHEKITASMLAERFGISIPRAQRTLRCTE